MERAPYLPPEPTKRLNNLAKEIEQANLEQPGAIAVMTPGSPPLTPAIVISHEVEEETEEMKQTEEVRKETLLSEEKRRKLSQRRKVLVAPTEIEGKGTPLEEIQEEEEPVVVRLRNRPTRSHTVNYGALHSMGASTLRRQSLSMLRQGHTGERGSRRFRAALRRDSIYEQHPGWDSIRRLGRVVG